ncbi:hypothetical protein GGQ60_000607 [Pedobacter zeae]|uniref:Uncharacterized protein n=1 Tax=Pedobacter zeae TaxID=1737356 RepID=A0A7W6K7P3_9SPHI|nr:hypothetical protein [Pedobacter zeae]
MEFIIEHIHHILVAIVIGVASDWPEWRRKQKLKKLNK